MTSYLDQFIENIACLRMPEGCPWHKEQDHKSLARYLLEETYEVLEAIHSQDHLKLKEELGDLLLQIVLHAQIAKENGLFDIQGVAESVNAKIIERLPHVFSDKTSVTAAEVMSRWRELKQARKPSYDREFFSVPPELPALLKALKVSEEAASQGFEWSNLQEVWEKLLSELKELQEALQNAADSRSEVELELGDVLFTIVNVARWQQLDPEIALQRAIDKFCCRFCLMKDLASDSLPKLTKEEMELLWEKAKTALC